MIPVILVKIGKHNDFHLSFFQLIGTWQDFTVVEKLVVLGDAVSKLETFVWILNQISRFITWSLFTLKASYLVKWSISTLIFHIVELFIDMFKFETRPSFLLNFGTANYPNSAVLKLKFRAIHTSCCPRSPCGGFYYLLVCIPKKGAVLLAESRNCLPLENIASSFSKPRLVLSDTGFLWPIKSNTAVHFACLNLYFCDRRIHFRFRYLASIVVQYLCQAFFIITELLPFIAGLVLWNLKRKFDSWRRRGRNLVTVSLIESSLGFWVLQKNHPLCCKEQLLTKNRLNCTNWGLFISFPWVPRVTQSLVSIAGCFDRWRSRDHYGGQALS